MAETHFKSKLKRIKTSFKDHKPVTDPRVDPSPTTSIPDAVTARSGRPARRSSEQPPAGDSLWALTLKFSLHWDPVPDLPPPSAARATALQSDEQWGCDPSEEVPPFPEPSPPPPRSSPSPGAVTSQTRPEPEPPARRHRGQSLNSKTAAAPALAHTPRPLLHSGTGPAAAAGPSSVGEPEAKRSKKEKGAFKGQLLRKEEVQRGGAAGGGGLQSCPMCLLVFPAGFTQMDCDGHLAQCLSEINMDMTW